MSAYTINTSSLTVLGLFCFSLWQMDVKFAYSMVLVHRVSYLFMRQNPLAWQHPLAPLAHL
jgi:hypothetical protein